MAAMDDKQPIIIKRVKKVVGGHHGGSWKIALADFAIAMMAFFLLLWLLANTTETQKIELQQFFSDPTGYMDKVGRLNPIDFGGSPSVLHNTNPSDSTDQIEAAQELSMDNPEELASSPNKESLEELQNSLLSAIESDELLSQFKNQLIIDIAPDGLHIQIVDNRRRPMFDEGSSRLRYYFAEILLQLAPELAKVQNKISIQGHTDSDHYSDNDNFGNWELSANRANAARRMLIEGGYPDNQVAQVVGLADSVPFDTDNPADPINRRIELVVLNRQAEQQLDDQSGEHLSDAAKARLDAARKAAELDPTPESIEGDSLDTRPSRRGAESQPGEVLDQLEQLLNQDSPYQPPPSVR